MRTHSRILCLGGLAAMLAVPGLCQQPPGGGPGPGGPGGPGGRFGPPPSPVVEVLDANHDGTIQAEEIRNAPTALLKLDRNKDGKLTPDEFRPPFPPGGPGGPGRPGGPGGPGRPGGPGEPGGPGAQAVGGPGVSRAFGPAADAPPQPAMDRDLLSKLFVGGARVSFQYDTMTVESNGIPNHKTDRFPNEYNPNAIREQALRFTIPLKPQRAAGITPTPFGPIGVALNGIPFYNQYNGQGEDAVRVEKFDSCCGHPDPSGLYHYHQYPVCIKSPFHDPEGQHSPVIGFMFDGYALCGPNGDDGQPAQGLDECSGHWDAARGYHYHATRRYPYLIGGYRGVVEARNFNRRGR